MMMMGYANSSFIKPVKYNQIEANSKNKSLLRKYEIDLPMKDQLYKPNI